MIKKFLVMLLIAIVILSLVNLTKAEDTINSVTDTTSSDPLRQQQIEKTQYFIENQYKDLVDENGITYNLDVKIKELQSNRLYESEPIDLSEGSARNILSAYKTIFEYSLTSNGDVVDIVKFEGFKFDNMVYRSGGNEVVKHLSYSYKYVPELDHENKIEIIKAFTSDIPRFGEESNNKYRKFAAEAVRSTNIVQNN